jgi:hypothetical protein
MNDTTDLPQHLPSCPLWLSKLAPSDCDYCVLHTTALITPTHPLTTSFPPSTTASQQQSWLPPSVPLASASRHQFQNQNQQQQDFVLYPQNGPQQPQPQQRTSYPDHLFDIPPRRASTHIQQQRLSNSLGLSPRYPNNPNQYSAVLPQQAQRLPQQQQQKQKHRLSVPTHNSAPVVPQTAGSVQPTMSGNSFPFRTHSLDLQLTPKQDNWDDMFQVDSFDSSTIAGADMSLFGTDMTVSPAALSVVNYSFESEPPSGRLPQYDFTPPTDLDCSPNAYSTSPAFAAESASSNYPPLFDTNQSPVDERNSLSMMRNLSSNSNSSSSGNARGHAKRPSLTKAALPSGVGKTRQRRPTKELAPISFDESDPVARKRARNTMAARVSRSNKAQKMEYLEKKVDKLQDRWSVAKAELIARGYSGPLLDDESDLEEA